MSKVMVIGTGVSQYPTIKAAQRLEHYVIGIDGSDKTKYGKLCNVFYRIDIKDIDAIVKIAKCHEIDAVIVPGTDFPVTAAVVANKLGIPGIPIWTAEVCSDKYYMREVLKKNGFLVPKYGLVDENNTIEKLPHMECPLVVKPVDNMAARGSIVIETYSYLQRAVCNAMKFSRSKKVIVEEFVEGMELSVDSLIWNNGDFIDVFAIADRHFDLYPHFIEMGHTMPTMLNNNVCEEIKKEFIGAIKTFGINIGAAKGDVKITSKGIMICEIAARISGGFMSGWTVPYAYGIQPHEALVKIHLGEQPGQELFRTKNPHNYSAERVFISIPGVIESITYPSSIFNVDCFMHVYPGDEVFFPENNAQRCGSVISANATRNGAINCAKEAIKDMHVILKPNVESTNDFLFGNKKDHEQDYDYRAFVPGDLETDWHGFDVQEALDKILRCTNAAYSQIKTDDNFWQAFYKGSVQGGIYYIHSFIK